jgi:hypothetical protein
MYYIMDSFLFRCHFLETFFFFSLRCNLFLSSHISPGILSSLLLLLIIIIYMMPFFNFFSWNSSFAFWSMWEFFGFYFNHSWLLHLLHLFCLSLKYVIYFACPLNMLNIKYKAIGILGEVFAWHLPVLFFPRYSKRK